MSTRDRARHLTHGSREVVTWVEELQHTWREADLSWARGLQRRDREMALEALRTQAEAIDELSRRMSEAQAAGRVVGVGMIMRAVHDWREHVAERRSQTLDYFESGNRSRWANELHRISIEIEANDRDEQRGLSGPVDGANRASKERQTASSSPFDSGLAPSQGRGPGRPLETAPGQQTTVTGVPSRMRRLILSSLEHHGVSYPRCCGSCGVCESEPAMTYSGLENDPGQPHALVTVTCSNCGAFVAGPFSVSSQGPSRNRSPVDGREQ